MPEIDERIAILETNQKNMREQLAEMDKKLSDIHQIIIEAKGSAKAARWVFILAAALAGLAGGKVAAFFGFISNKM